MPDKTTKNLSKITKTIDYLIFGHLTADLTEFGPRLGGTAAFSGLTGQAFGLNTCIVTSFSDNLDTSPLAAASICIKNKPSEQTTTFKNISDGVHRTQYLFQRAQNLTTADCPDLPSAPAMVHLGPVAAEVDPDILHCYKNSLKCLTPQGWFRRTNDDFKVENSVWDDYENIFSAADIAVVSLEDVQNDESIIRNMAEAVPVLAVTENFRGARVYWHSDARFLNAPEVKYIDDTGAGDIFAAAFFFRYFSTRDPWEAGRYAVLLASWSVTRQHLNSIPTDEEIEKAKLELLNS